MRARLAVALCCAAAGGCAATPTKLFANKEGHPREVGMNKTDLCKGRTHKHDECSVLLDVPSGCANDHSTCPVAFFLHGEADNGKEFARGPRAVSSAVHKAQFIGVYPTGDGEWNVDVKTGNDDVEFMVSLVDYISTLGAFNNWVPKMGEPPVGTPGLYFYGTGTGAALVQKLGANAAARLPIRGIWADGAQLLEAPLQSGPGDMNFNQPGQGHKSAPVAQMASHGTKDTVFPYEGGKPKTQHNCSTCKLMSEPNSNLAWAKHNGCNTTKPTIQKNATATYGLVSAKTGEATKTSATMHTFQDCPDVAQVHYWSILNAPHGGADTIDDTPMSELVLDFFKAIEFVQPAHLPGVKRDIWEDPGVRDPIIAGIVILVCFCCIFCGFCQSGSLKGR